ncbi:MAG: hypothetical protein EON86_00700 [Brevundimonas sp.]|nr:MAG: hypothetical protein EON86_00700 [Brevundimonas sp.]
MKTWAWMLGGLIVWSVHFIGVYMISSVADVVSTADDPAWRMAGLAFGGACVLITGLLLAVALRRLRESLRFADQLAAFGAGTASIAIIWQSLPTLIGF